MSKKAQYVIGIDGGQNTGFAVYCRRTKKLVEVKKYTFWEALKRLEHWIEDCKVENLEVLLEDVEHHKPTFWRGQHSQAVNNMISQRVGRNKRDCQLLKEWLAENGLNFTAIPPTKYSLTKMDAKAFKAYTGWQESTNEHSRDAAALCFGR